ncbi:MAG: hypothetical protein EYC69_12030 [Bacteroidetes bacterium]|nr:MAG: hypothetical protein EYC69_12030 [Bacteroidota bacterium]
MIRFFKSPQPAALFAIPLIVILLWAERFFDFPPAPETYEMPLWTLFALLFTSLPSWINFFIFVSLISFQAIYLNLLANKHEVLYRNSYLPALFYVLLVSAIPSFLLIHPIHFVSLILLRIFDKVFSFHKHGRMILSIFDCGFLAATAALLYFPAIPILLLLMFSLSIMRPFNIREWLVLIIGYLVPFMFLSVLKFWNYELEEFWTQFFAKIMEPAGKMHMPSSLELQVLIVVVLFMLLLSWMRLRANYYKNIIRARTYQQILFFSFVLGIVSIFFSKDPGRINLIILTIPVSLWFAYYFVSQKKKMWFVEALLWVFIASIAWNHFAGI